jgi:hypothetical protein
MSLHKGEKAIHADEAGPSQAATGADVGVFDPTAIHPVIDECAADSDEFGGLLRAEPFRTLGGGR